MSRAAALPNAAFAIDVKVDAGRLYGVFLFHHICSVCVPDCTHRSRRTSVLKLWAGHSHKSGQVKNLTDLTSDYGRAVPSTLCLLRHRTSAVGDLPAPKISGIGLYWLSMMMSSATARLQLVSYSKLIQCDRNQSKLAFRDDVVCNRQNIRLASLLLLESNTQGHFLNT